MHMRVIKWLAAAAVLALLAANCVGLFLLRRDIQWFQEQTGQAQNTLMARMSALDASLARQRNEFADMLRQEQSLFSDYAIEMRLQEGNLAVTVQATPKEQMADEILSVRIDAGESSYEQLMDENGRTTFLLGHVGSLRPTLILRSDAGVRQEVLEEIYTDSYFTYSLYSQWGEGDSGPQQKEELTLWLTPPESGAPFSTQEIQQATFLVYDTGVTRLPPEGGEGSASASISAAETPARPIPEQETLERLEKESERLPAEQLAGEGENWLGFRADLSPYTQREDGVEYEVYLAVTTQDGMRYFTREAVATFCSTGRSSDKSSGDGLLQPIFSQSR